MSAQKSFTTLSLHKQGFTLVELLVVISIIAILSVIGVTIFSSAQNSAKKAKLGADFDAIYKNIEQTRIINQKSLSQITGSNCSECGCRGSDANNCLSTMTTAYAKVTSAQLPLDPWGRPYTFDENEGETGVTDCRFDTIDSAGPDNILRNSDDICYLVPLAGYLGCNAGTAPTGIPCHIWPQTGL